jgi:hypothetical protein
MLDSEGIVPLVSVFGECAYLIKVKNQDRLDVEATSMSSQVFTARRRVLGVSFCLTSGAFTLCGLRLASATGAWLLFKGLSDICECCPFCRRRRTIDDCDRYVFQYVGLVSSLYACAKCLS